MMEYTDFPIEYYNEVNNDQALLEEAEERIRKLARGHHDITGATVKLTPQARNRETAYAYEATVILYVRPSTIVGKEEGDNLEGVLRGALSAVERQVREKREKLSNH